MVQEYDSNNLKNQFTFKVTYNEIANTYMNRAIGQYLQQQGIYVIPNVRWCDERSYTTCELIEKFAFFGLQKHSIVSIGT